eukprot:TRINITY_DN5072_c1_g1_i1.p1 TRINITY_DN5072_c1_g1~~TRINITY_DN5072_c1_g1_i1.p1  ORF type:complete len:186 (-),score=18.85 TRINITY_DN5072_c1_g1_i1:104-661(-)
MEPSAIFVQAQTCLEQMASGFSWKIFIECNKLYPIHIYFLLVYYTLTNFFVMYYISRKSPSKILTAIGFFGLIFGIFEHLALHIPALTIDLTTEKIFGRGTTLLGIEFMTYDFLRSKKVPLLLKAVFLTANVVGTIAAFSQGQLQTDAWAFHFQHAVFTHGGIVFACIVHNYIFTHWDPPKEKQK